MLPAYLLSEGAVQEDGWGSQVALESTVGQPVLITLGITRILECESLEVSLWGSADGSAWRVLASFPPKYYCGTYGLPVNLSAHGDVRFVRARWKMRRWEPRNQRALFDFYVFAEKMQTRVAGAA